MTPADQLAHFSGSTDDLAMSGLWYSHKRVTELVQAAKEAGAAEARDEVAQLKRDIAGQTRSAQNGWRTADAFRDEVGRLRHGISALTEGLCECGSESCIESAWLIALTDVLESK